MQPDIESFLGYSRRFYDEHRFTNNGPLVRLLEARLAELHQSEHCITFASGFWALVLAMHSLAVPGRSEVVLPSFTYRRMADLAWWARLVPRFCDVERETLAVSRATVEPCINKDTALLLGVHPIVNCCPADELEALAADHGLPLLFDAVESAYETYGGRKVGTFGSAEVFSMHASKLLNGFEGGYVTTDDDELAGRLRYQRGFGFKGLDNVEMLGVNSKLNEVHAAMALAALDDLDAQVERNRARYWAYRDKLASVRGIRLVEFDEGERCGFKNIVVELLDDWPFTRQETLDALHAEGMLARPYYSPALHQKPASYRTEHGPLPVTEECEPRFLVLPSGARVSLDDVDLVVAFLAFLSSSGSRLGSGGRSSAGSSSTSGSRSSGSGHDQRAVSA